MNNTLVSIEGDINLGILTDGDSRTCITMPPTSAQVVIGKFGIITSHTEGPLESFKVQIVTNGTNTTSCTDLNLANYLKTGPCPWYQRCELTRECMKAGFCNYNCPCYDGQCELHLIDSKMKLQANWQLCDILV